MKSNPPLETVCLKIFRLEAVVLNPIDSNAAVGHVNGRLCLAGAFHRSMKSASE